METPFNPGECAEFMSPPPHKAKRVVSLLFHEGIPENDGWYLVELEENTIRRKSGQPFDVDYCRAQSPSDGGGREWVIYYPDNIKRWAKLPENS